MPRTGRGQAPGAEMEIAELRTIARRAQDGYADALKTVKRLAGSAGVVGAQGGWLTEGAGGRTITQGWANLAASIAAGEFATAELAKRMAAAHSDERRITWKRDAGTRTGVAVAYTGTTEAGVIYRVEARDTGSTWDIGAGRGVRTFRAFRVVANGTTVEKLHPAGAGGALKTRKAAYEQAEADLTDVLVEREGAQRPPVDVVASRLRTAIIGAYHALTEVREGFVTLADLRDRLSASGARDHDAVSRELVAMYREQIANLVPWADNSRVTAHDRAAAVECGGESKHRVSVYDQLSPATGATGSTALVARVTEAVHLAKTTENPIPRGANGPSICLRAGESGHTAHFRAVSPECREADDDMSGDDMSGDDMTDAEAEAYYSRLREEPSRVPYIEVARTEALAEHHARYGFESGDLVCMTDPEGLGIDTETVWEVAAVHDVGTVHAHAELVGYDFPAMRSASRFARLAHAPQCTYFMGHAGAAIRHEFEHSPRTTFVDRLCGQVRSFDGHLTDRTRAAATVHAARDHEGVPAPAPYPSGWGGRAAWGLPDAGGRYAVQGLPYLTDATGAGVPADRDAR